MTAERATSRGMTTAERIETYTKAAKACGLPVREVIVEGRKVRILFGDEGEVKHKQGLRKNWGANEKA